MPKQIKDPVVPWDQPGSHKMEVAKTSCESAERVPVAEFARPTSIGADRVTLAT